MPAIPTWAVWGTGFAVADALSIAAAAASATLPLPPALSYPIDGLVTLAQVPGTVLGAPILLLLPPSASALVFPVLVLASMTAWFLLGAFLGLRLRRRAAWTLRTLQDQP